MSAGPKGRGSRQGKARLINKEANAAAARRRWRLRPAFDARKACSAVAGRSLKIEWQRGIAAGLHTHTHPIAAQREVDAFGFSRARWTGGLTVFASLAVDRFTVRRSLLVLCTVCVHTPFYKLLHVWLALESQVASWRTAVVLKHGGRGQRQQGGIWRLSNFESSQAASGKEQFGV